MNDLERDLHDLFSTKARDVDAAPAAPVPVLRRARRRQTATIVAGALGSAAAIALAVAVVMSVTRTPDRVPANPVSDVPERVTSIGGVPVTAPAGWTLINDWPLATAIGTSSEVCTFEGEGVPVGQTDQGQAAPGEGSCVETPADLPAGLPVLQLANWEIPLLETVCGLADQPATALPSDGVAVYVGHFPTGVTTDGFMDACPGSENVSDMSAVTTFMSRHLANGTPTGTYAAIVVAGVGASADDLAVGAATLESLGGITIQQSVPVGGPGYVLAAGTSGPNEWRFEAGFESLTDPQVRPSATLTLEDERSSGVETVLPSTGTAVESIPHWFSDDLVVTFGTAGGLVDGVDIVTGDRSTAASMFAWPAGLVTATQGEAIEGSLWFATTGERGEVMPVLPDGLEPTEPPSATGRIETRIEGDALVGTIDAFGRSIDVSVAQGIVQIEGADTSGSLINGSSFQFDVEGGTLLVAQHDPEVRDVHVTTSDGSRFDGSWMAADDSLGASGKLWIVPLPGTGAGLAHVDGSPFSTALSWPTHETPQEGDVVSAGADELASWAIRWKSGCPRLDVSGTATAVEEGTGCILPWDPADAGLVVGGSYGGDVATVWITGPEGMQLEPPAGTTDPVYAQCGTHIAAAGWEDTDICVVSFEAGRTVQLEPVTIDGASLGRRLELTANDGALEMT